VNNSLAASHPSFATVEFQIPEAQVPRMLAIGLSCATAR
jgi:hypothetical protein